MGRMPSLLFVCLVASVAAATAQNQAPLAYFEQIDEGVYSGSKPRTDQDFRFLQSHHVRYLIEARFLPLLSGSEKKRAKRFGMTLLTFPMNASPISPSRAHVNKILLALHDRQLHPVYLHCVLGRDRTGLLAGLYKIYFLGIPKQEAWEQMKRSGFRTVWFVHGLKLYFDKYADRPPST